LQNILSHNCPTPKRLVPARGNIAPPRSLYRKISAGGCPKGMALPQKAQPPALIFNNSLQHKPTVKCNYRVDGFLPSTQCVECSEPIRDYPVKNLSLPLIPCKFIPKTTSPESCLSQNLRKLPDELPVKQGL